MIYIYIKFSNWCKKVIKYYIIVIKYYSYYIINIFANYIIRNLMIPLFFVWLILFTSSFIIAIRSIISKWLLNKKISSSTIFLITNIFYLITAFIVFVFIKDGFKKFKEDVKEKMGLKQWLSISIASILTIVFGYLFLKSLDNREISILSPTRSILIIILIIIFGIFFLSEKITMLGWLALFLMITGFIVMIYNTYKNKNVT